MSVIVQYVLIRGDLIKSLKWPVGAVVAQACHASTAAIHLFYNDESTQLYLKDLENMHKIILEVPDEDSLKKLSAQLSENSIGHKMWIEQPENIATCIALKPSPKEQVQHYFKKLKLMKGYKTCYFFPNNSTRKHILHILTTPHTSGSSDFFARSWQTHWNCLNLGLRPRNNYEFPSLLKVASSESVCGWLDLLV